MYTYISYSLYAIRETYFLYIIRETNLLYAIEKTYSLLTYPFQNSRARHTATLIPLIAILSYLVLGGVCLQHKLSYSTSHFF